MIHLDRFWKAEEGDGATPEELAEWERDHAVRLPRLLREALAIRDGGALRDAPITIAPLAEIQPVGPEFWEAADFEYEVADRSLVFEFAQHGEVDLGFLLDYNANGPEGEATVACYTHGEIEIEPAADSLDEFLTAQIGTDETPAVEWDETTDASDLIARELIEISTWDGDQSSLEQVLIQRDGGLIFYTRQRDARSEVLSKTVLPGPILAPLATINAYRPPPASTLALHLQTDAHDGIVYLASSRSDDAGWRNSESLGAPIYVAFESADRERLEAVRSAVLGPEAQVAEARQASQNAMSERLDSLTPEARQAAMIQAAMSLRQEMLKQYAGASPEATDSALSSVSQAIQEQIEKLSKRPDGAPEIDPETLRLITEGLRPPGLDPASRDKEN